VRQLNSQVVQLQHACAPVNTGGGVTQCANPTITETEKP
jgi:hypothetical protein